LRILGWLLAANAVGLLIAVASGASVAEATQQFAGWCGIG
jgi:hypothetical protein